MKTKTGNKQESKSLFMDLEQCGCCGEKHSNIEWKPVCEMKITCKGKEISHFAICPKKQDLVLLVKA